MPPVVNGVFLVAAVVLGTFAALRAKWGVVVSRVLLAFVVAQHDAALVRKVANDSDMMAANGQVHDALDDLNLFAAKRA